jgi:L-fuculose-phosphate aldolase
MVASAAHTGQQDGSMDFTLDLAGCMQRVSAAGLSAGTSGNASLRTEEGMRITPSGVAPALLDALCEVHMRLDGSVLAGTLEPSSEWRMHAAIYAAHPEVAAIVHCHSRHATALACCGLGIPAFHYMVAVAGGDAIRCAPYALFGSGELAAHAVAALEGRRACLLGNHGQIATGSSLGAALSLAVEVEELAAQYLLALSAGGPRILDGQQMREVIDRFAGYGQPQERGT